MTVLHDSVLENVLTALHERSDAQRKAMADADVDDAGFVSDKLVALDRDKAEFCYQLLRAMDAHRVVEIGTSYGVSTLYLAAALRDMKVGERRVIGTEHEPTKCESARLNLQAAGLADFVEIREGDLRETLLNLVGPIDFVLVDIWTETARTALEIVYPHLRPGAVVVCDNTNDREAYADYFDFIGAPSHHFRTMTLPFSGGFEMSVFCPNGRRS